MIHYIYDEREVIVEQDRGYQILYNPGVCSDEEGFTVYALYDAFATSAAEMWPDSPWVDEPFHLVDFGEFGVKRKGSSELLTQMTGWTWDPVADVFWNGLDPASHSFINLGAGAVFAGGFGGLRGGVPDIVRPLPPENIDPGRASTPPPAEKQRKPAKPTPPPLSRAEEIRNEIANVKRWQKQLRDSIMAGPGSGGYDWSNPDHISTVDAVPIVTENPILMPEAKQMDLQRKIEKSKRWLESQGVKIR